MDTATKSTDCTYDWIIVTGDIEDNIMNSSTERLDLAFGLDKTQTTAISDHYPVYAMIAMG